MEDHVIIGQQIQGYQIVQKLGSGGYGAVYLGEKEDLGKKYQTAIKHISIPDAEGYNTVLQDYGYDKQKTQEHFEKMVEGITAEINTLLELSKKDNRYIVAYYDHDIQKSAAPLRFDVFLRMEYLTPLDKYVRSNGITLGQIIRLGLNMCEALSLCHHSGITHRDIKEANIFVSESGNFKLGDFGVAKAMLEATQSGSIKGTASYMAPEIYFREPYDSSVDIYSLGIVLYRLLNDQRLPFMPQAPDSFTVDDKNLAETRRLKGEVPPLPARAKNRLGEIVVKACSPKTERYAGTEELKADLQAYLQTITADDYNTVMVSPSLDAEDSAASYEDSLKSRTQTQGAPGRGASGGGSFSPTVEQNPYAETGAKDGKKKSKKKAVWGCIAAVLIVAVGIAGYVAYRWFTDPVRLFETAITDGDYTGAAQLYQEKIRNGDTEQIEQARELVSGIADEAKRQYIDGEIDYESALAQLQEMSQLGAVRDEELQAIIAEINELRTSRVAYENAQKNIGSNDWESAIRELRKVIQADANYTEAQTQLADAIRSYKDALLEEVLDYDADKDYNGAIMVLQAGLQVVPDDADLLTRIQDFEKKIEDEIRLEIERIVREAKTSASASADYVGALAVLRDAAKQYPGSEEIKAAISEVEDGYLAAALANAQAIAAESGYKQAVAALNEALKILPDNASIKAAISEYEAKYPVLLQQMVYFTGRELGNDGQEMDNMQEMQINVIRSGFDNTYKLDGKYVRITGVLYQPFDERSDGDRKTLEIFGDGRLLYSASMSGGIEPIPFNVDISGVSDLEIKFENDTYRTAYAHLANVELYQ